MTHISAAAADDDSQITLPTVVAVLAAIFSSIQLIPQLYKCYANRHAKDLSLWSILLMLATNLLWLLHGIFINDTPLLYAGIIATSVNLALLGVYLHFTRNPN